MKKVEQAKIPAQQTKLIQAYAKIFTARTTADAISSLKALQARKRVQNALQASVKPNRGNISNTQRINKTDKTVDAM